MKRTFDLVSSLFALVLLAPFLMIIGLAVLVALGRPVLFSQERPGLGGQPFTLYKFRTMLAVQDGVHDDKLRLTRFGKFLRATSLDELPELWNVLIGDMSFVGPRPLLMEYLELYSDEQMRRHEVRPGITGWAQVKGRNSLSWDEKFALDVWYVQNRTLWLDIKILFLTVLTVIRRDGIAAEGEATMSKFTGSN